MSLSTDNALISENTIHNNSHNPSVETNPSHIETTSHGESEAPAPKDVFNHYMKSLGTHRELNLFHYHIMDLPVILYDGQEGLHIYKDINTMEQEGLFTEVHHKIVHKDNIERSVAFDASITSLVCFQWLAMIIALVMFFIAGRRAKKNPDKAPHGIHNLLETVVVFIKEQVVAPNVPGKNVVNKLQHYFYAIFFFILFMNLLGLVPGGHTATGAIGTTLALALTAFIVINVTAMKEAGIGAWFKHLLGGAPWWLFFIMVPIELISLFTKPFALTIRLFANMTAGHVVLLSFIGLIIYLQSFVMAPVAVSFSIFMLVLELLVAFLQAYIFTILTAVFTGLAIGEHSEHAHAH